MGETRVDLQHLLEDLRDAHMGALEVAISRVVRQAGALIQWVDSLHRADAPDSIPRAGALSRLLLSTTAHGR